MGNTNFDDINYDEINEFITQLRKKRVSVIVEYKNDLPVKIFFKLPRTAWFGINILDKKERIYEEERYCGISMWSKGEIAEYTPSIHGKHWETLTIDDFDIYVQNAMEEEKWSYFLYMKRQTENEYDIEDDIEDDMEDEHDMEDLFPFNLDADIALRDCFMDIYTKKQEGVGIKFVYY